MTSQDLSGFIGPPSSATTGADPFSDLYNTTANKLNERIKKGAQGQGFFKLLLRMLLGRMAGGDSNENEIKDLSYLFSHLTSIKQGREQIKAEKEARLEQLKVQGDMQKELIKLQADFQAKNIKTQLDAEKEKQVQEEAFKRYQFDITHAANEEERKAAEKRFKISTDITKQVSEREAKLKELGLFMQASEGASERANKKDMQKTGINAEAAAQERQIGAQEKAQEKSINAQQKLQSNELGSKERMGLYGLIQQFSESGANRSQANQELRTKQQMQDKELKVKQEEGDKDRGTQMTIAGARMSAAANKVTPEQEKFQAIVGAESPNLINAFRGTSETNVQEGKLGAGEGPVAQLMNTFSSPAYMQAYTELAQTTGQEVVDAKTALKKANIDPEKEMEKYVLQHRQQGQPIPEDLFGVPVETAKQRVLQYVQNEQKNNPAYRGDNGVLLGNAGSKMAVGIGQLQDVYRSALDAKRQQVDATDKIKNQLEEDFQFLDKNAYAYLGSNVNPRVLGRAAPKEPTEKLRSWRQQFSILDDEKLFDTAQAEAKLKKFRETVQKDPLFGKVFQQYLQSKK